MHILFVGFSALVFVTVALDGQRQILYSIRLKLQRCLPPQSFSPGSIFFIQKMQLFVTSKMEQEQAERTKLF